MRRRFLDWLKLSGALWLGRMLDFCKRHIKKIITLFILSYIFFMLGYFSLRDELVDQRRLNQEFANQLQEHQVDYELHYKLVMYYSQELENSNALDPALKHQFHEFEKKGWPLKPKPWRKFKSDYTLRIMTLMKRYKRQKKNK